MVQKQELNRASVASSNTEELFKTRQCLRELGEWDAVRDITKEIKRSIRKDRLNHLLRNLEEELWHDIKKARRGFTPKHTKLCDDSGSPITSRDRPNVLADYFENKQWFIDPDRHLPPRKQKIFSAQSDIRCGPITLEELRAVLKFMKKQ